MRRSILMPYALAIYITISSMPVAIIAMATDLWSSLIAVRATRYIEQPNVAYEQHCAEQQAGENYAEHIVAMPATDYAVASVIVQAKSPWSAVLWINIGTEDQLPFTVQVNCPVLDNNIVVGVIDFVGKRSSRVRLISDPKFRLAVRVERGAYEDRIVRHSINVVQQSMQRHPQWLPTAEVADAMKKMLDHISSQIDPKSCLLAKGELTGSDDPDASTTLLGRGFNYDFSDDVGVARDLRTGRPTDGSLSGSVSLILPGDMLVTSGLDGYFPKHLPVALVKKVFPLEEGAISYRIIAESLSAELPDLEYVTVIPAQENDASGFSEMQRIEDLIQGELQGSI